MENKGTEKQKKRIGFRKRLFSFVSLLILTSVFFVSRPAHADVGFFFELVYLFIIGFNKVGVEGGGGSAFFPAEHFQKLQKARLNQLRGSLDGNVKEGARIPVQASGGHFGLHGTRGFYEFNFRIVTGTEPFSESNFDGHGGVVSNFRVRYRNRQYANAIAGLDLLWKLKTHRLEPYIGVSRSLEKGRKISLNSNISASGLLIPSLGSAVYSAETFGPEAGVLYRYIWRDKQSFTFIRLGGSQGVGRYRSQEAEYSRASSSSLFHNGRVQRSEGYLMGGMQIRLGGVFSLETRLSYRRAESKFRMDYIQSPELFGAPENFLGEQFDMITRFRNTSIHSDETTIKVGLKIHWRSPIDGSK